MPDTYTGEPTAQNNCRSGLTFVALAIRLQHGEFSLGSEPAEQSGSDDAPIIVSLSLYANSALWGGRI